MLNALKSSTVIYEPIIRFAGIEHEKTSPKTNLLVDEIQEKLQKVIN